MFRFVIRRMLFSIPVLIISSVLVFIVVKAAANPTAALTQNPRIRVEDVARIRHSLGLDKSGWEQYTSWLSHFVRGDFGESLIARRPVGPDIRSALANSIILGVAGIILSLFIGVGIGILSALRQYSLFDQAATGAAFFGLSMPNFWLALSLQVFFGLYLTKWLGMSSPIFYTQGLSDPTLTHFDLLDRVRHLVLPAIVLAVQIIAVYSRLVRASMLEVMHADYIRTARAKGIPERQVVAKHGVRNALVPVLTQVGLDVGAIAGGLIVTEAVFNYPGMGQFFVDAMREGDYPQILPWMMIVVSSVILFNLIVDIAYAALDPRIRYA
jgi:ABC-type dipeptide/oligopeptide/nickel transport system permease component